MLAEVEFHVEVQQYRDDVQLDGLARQARLLLVGHAESLGHRPVKSSDATAQNDLLLLHFGDDPYHSELGVQPREFWVIPEWSTTSLTRQSLYRVVWQRPGQPGIPHGEMFSDLGELLVAVEPFFEDYTGAPQVLVYEALTARLVEQLELVLRDHRDGLIKRIAALTGEVESALARVAALEREVRTLRDTSRERGGPLKVAVLGAAAVVVGALIGGGAQAYSAHVTSAAQPAVVEPSASDQQIDLALEIASDLASNCAPTVQQAP